MPMSVVPTCCRRGLRAGWLVGIGMLLAVESRGADGLADYLVDVWDTENGLPNSSVTAVTQTRDGYLWVGTYDGLARFDGVRFVTFNTPALGHARIQDLFVDASGTLWINTYRGGLTSYRDGEFRREWPGRGEFDVHTVLANSTSNQVRFVTQFGEVLERSGPAGRPGTWTTFSPPGGARYLYQCTDGEGVLWFLTRDGHIARLVGQEFQDLPAGCGLADAPVAALAADPAGRVWAGTEREVALWEGGRFRAMSPTNDAPLQAKLLLPTRGGTVWVLADERLRRLAGGQWTAEARQWRGLLGWASGRSMGMHEDREGGVWFNHYGNGLFHITPDGTFQRFTTHEGLPGDRAWAWFEGREGDIWVGTDRGGLARLRPRQFRVVGAAEGLPARAALSVCEDHSGNLWFGTSGGGLCRWRDGELATFPVGANLSRNFVFSIFPQAGPGLWLSADAGEDLCEFRGRAIERAPWEVHGVKALWTDRAGRVWTGTKTGLEWHLGERRRIFGAADGLPASAVRVLAEANDGTLWCGNDDGTLYRCEPDRLQSFRPGDALAGQPIWSMLVERDGTIWAGTFRGGLLRFRAGKFARVTMREGLPSDVVSQILDDGRGQLWLGTHQGICRAGKDALNACLDGKTRRVDCVTYGRLDGLPTLECGGNYQPSCWRARDGHLWFATVKGMVAVNPAELQPNPVPPPVVLEELRVDGEPVPLGHGPVVIPPGREQFEFRFTALSFIAPDRVQFRYHLEGVDSDWVEAGTRRVAYYGHLPARNYRFQVRACNNDGLWSNAGTELAFVVRPYFYETWWFLTVAGAALVGGVAAGVQRATGRKYQLELARVHQQHAIERDRARIAQDIHDDLGAGLTQITLLSELARRDPPEVAVSHLERISDSARKLTRRMDEIVWAVDPQHDTLSGLMDYISAFTEDFLRVAGIRCRMDLPAELPGVRVDAELRYNLFLALKESLNNIVRHAHATEVWLRLRLEPGGFRLVVEDNGQGLRGKIGLANSSADARPGSGHGLPNLQQRLEAIGGACTVTSSNGGGTQVEMTVRLNGAASPIMATSQSAAEPAS